MRMPVPWNGESESAEKRQDRSGQDGSEPHHQSAKKSSRDDVSRLIQPDNDDGGAGRPASRGANEDPDGDGLVPSTNSIPVRFSCSRCTKCKYQSRGTFYCRVSQLHLLAPAWDEHDQTKRWEIPRGYLKWLRREGPVEGCEVRESAKEPL